MEETVLKLLEERNFFKLRSMLESMNPADISIMLEDFSEEDVPRIFRIMPKELAAETFVNMEPDDQEKLILAFSDKELREVLDEMYLDDTVDMIEEMPANVVQRILRESDAAMRSEINKVLKYPKDSAGSLMTIEYVDLRRDMTVAQAFDRIRATGVDKETIYTCYVKDLNRKLIGVITVKALLLSSYDEVVENIMETNLISVRTTEDKEEVAKMFDKYDFLAMPVVDNENRLVGIITVDDAMDVIQEENTEDIEKMAAIIPSEKPYLKTGIYETWKQRIPWLLLLMISATFTGGIISSFEDSLAKCVALTAFIPMLMDTGGNSGGQSSVTIIRSLSLNEVEMKDIFKIIWKEVRVAFFCGLTLAAANFVKMMIVDRNMISNSGNPITIAIVVCITLMTTVIIAKFIGCSLPMIAKKIGFDPAVMASPFITTIVDAISLLVYFKVATMLLGIA